MYIGVSPVRISFAGGGTDMPEYYEKFGGNVISTTISLFTYLLIKPRVDDLFQAFSTDFEIHHLKTSYKKLKAKAGTEIAVSAIKHLNFQKGADFLICSDVQPGSGLGTSSSLTVNFVNTLLKLQNKHWKKEKIAETAFHIERNILHNPIGKQDDYIASFGGFNFIKFEKDKVKINRINIKKSTMLELQKNLLLFNTGSTRKSSVILSKQQKLTKDMNKNTINSLKNVQQLAEELYDSLKRSNITEFGETLHKGWLAKKKFTKGVSNELIDSIYRSGINEGALGGKLTGAGGGGHILFYCEKPKQNRLIKKMTKMGLNHILFNFHSKGPQVLNLYDFIK